MRLRRSDLCHPLPIAAIAALLVNDHVLKGSGLVPAIVTGKLSDVAGLFFFPVLLTVVVELGAGFPRKRVALACTVATGVVFALLKTVPELALVASSLWGRVVCDPTDLFALPALVASLLFLERDVRAAPSPAWARATIIGLAALASVATSRPMQARNYPAWETQGAERDLGCAHASAYVAKTGKEGFGVVVRLDAARECVVSVVRAIATIGAERVTVVELPAEAALTSPAPRFLYLPFAFDNEAAWNDGRRTGSAELVVRVEGREDTWVFPLVERFDGFHRTIDYRAQPAPSGPVLERAGDAP